MLGYRLRSSYGYILQMFAIASRMFCTRSTYVNKSQRLHTVAYIKFRLVKEDEPVILNVPRGILNSQDCETKRQVFHLSLLQARVPERFSVSTRLRTNRSRMFFVLRNTTRGGSSKTLQALGSALRKFRFWKVRRCCSFG